MQCSLGEWWTYPAWLPVLVQGLGLAVVFYGLGKTWYEWSRSRPREAVAALLAKVTAPFRRQDATVTPATVRATTTIPRPSLGPSPPPSADAPVQEVLAYVRAVLAHQHVAQKVLADDLTEARQRIEAVAERDRQRADDLRQRVEAVAQAWADELSRYALSGLGVASLGALLSLVGLALAWPTLCT